MPGTDRALARRLDPTLSRGAPVGRILARQESHISEDDERLEDPGFLMCTAFCYLGIPPSMFKDIVAGMLQAAYEHFRETDITRSRERFNEYRRELAVYSKLRLLAKAFRFLMTGELGLGLALRGATATAIRERLLARLVAAGLRTGGLAAAEQVVRKVVLAIDAVIAAGCGAYCGAMAGARAIIEVTEATVEGLASALRVLRALVRGSVVWSRTCSRELTGSSIRRTGQYQSASPAGPGRMSRRLESRSSPKCGQAARGGTAL
jgi:hypothetical protein